MSIEIGSLYKIKRPYSNYKYQYIFALAYTFSSKIFISNEPVMVLTGINLNGDKSDYILFEEELEKVA